MKKIISLCMAVLFFLLQNPILIRAMDTHDLPVSKGDPLKPEDIDRIGEAFRQGRNGATDFTLSYPAFWESRREKDLVDPNLVDFRRIVVRNIPELMGKKLDDNFIRNMIEMRLEAQKVIKRFDRERQIGNFSKKVTIELNERFFKDPECIRALDSISRELKIDRDDIANAFIAWGISKALTDQYSREAITEFLLAGGMAGVAAAVAAGGVWYFGGVVALKTTLASSVAAICVACGIAALTIGGIILAVFALDKADNEVIAKFKLQKCENLSFLIQRFFDSLVMESRTVMKSNVLVTGIDERTFKTSGLLWHLRNRHLPNHGYWCGFRAIEGLPYSPAAETYRNPYYGKYLSYFIDILRDMEYHEVRSVDFERLTKYLDGTIIPRQITLPSAEHRRHLIDTMDPEELIKMQDEFAEEELEEIFLRAAEKIRAKRQQRSSHN